MTAAHQDLILDQFTRQAIPFSTAKIIADDKALRAVVDLSGAGPEDTVLDVGCGGGLVVCAFAAVARHVTGIDLTPAMLDRAQHLAQSKGLSNVSWQQGDVYALPFPNASFNVVVSRFTFHHFQDPRAVLKEMRRVCVPGGRVLIIDVITSDDPEKAAAFNRIEVLRDPSHVRAMPLDELRGLLVSIVPGEPQMQHYQLRDELENLLARSFPLPGDADKIRDIFRDSAASDRLGIPIHLEAQRVHYAYPVAILCATVP